MIVLLLKILLTPCLIALATAATRRWGPAIGGWLAGLPFSAGPILGFLAFEQGPGFCAAAAAGTLPGLVAFSAFGWVYAASCRNMPWPLALALALATWFPLAAAGAFLGVPLALAIPAPLISAGVALAIWPRTNVAVNGRCGLASLPWRMFAAVLLTLLVTGIAHLIGSAWSGVLAVFPVVSSVMAVFAQRDLGPTGAVRTLRGLVLGTASLVAFMTCLALLMGRWPSVLVFLLASLAALALQAAVLPLVRSR